MMMLNLIVKRLFDIIISLFGLVLFFPAFLIIVVLIKVFMPGSIFFFQERVGKNGKIFKIFKLRTMKVDLEAERSFDSSRDSERTPPLGKFLRRFKIDEVVQLINVLKGDMSLVGPRPALKIQTDNYGEYEKQRLKMAPGMTGLAQVNGNASLTWEKRIKYDIEYIDNFSFFLDIKILMKTVLIVLFGEERFIEENKKTELEKVAVHDGN